jgi:hypothetical protein
LGLRFLLFLTLGGRPFSKGRRIGDTGRRICTMTASGEVEFLNRPVLDEYFGKTLDEFRNSTLRNEVSFG